MWLQLPSRALSKNLCLLFLLFWGVVAMEVALCVYVCVCVCVFMLYLRGAVFCDGGEWCFPCVDRRLGFVWRCVGVLCVLSCAVLSALLSPSSGQRP